MTEEPQCTGLRQNPELFRIILLKTIEELTDCIGDSSATMLSTENPEKQLLHNQVKLLQSVFKKSLEDVVNYMWNEQQISKKISFLNDLATKYPPDFNAWRPTTGEIPIENLKGHYLTETKQRLLLKMKQCEAESDELKKTLSTKASALRKSFKKISKAEESLFKLSGDYEKIIRDDN